MDTVVDEKILAEIRRGRTFPAFALIGWRWVARNPVATIVPILLPFFFLYFLALISPPSLFPLQIVGAMLFATQNIGSWCLSDSAHWRLEQRLQDMFVASPLGKFQYLFGIAFSNLIPAMPALIILGILLSLETPVTLFGWFVLAAAIVMVWVLYSAIGIAVSSRLRSQMDVWPVGNLVFTTLGILSPLYYPLAFLADKAPLWAAVARFLPATYAALIVQSALNLQYALPAEAPMDAILLVVSTLIGIVLAMTLYTWRER
jgi:ABC-type multidrug transport system permease subunit